MRRSLVLLRHGQTAWNLEGRAQGHADVPLDDTGRLQAAAAADVLARLGAAALWSSDLARARETAETVAARCRLPVQLDKRLRELDVGVRSGLTWAEYAERYPEEYASRGSAAPLPVPGEEAAELVAARMGAALRECLAALEDGQSGIVVSHGACLKDGIGELLGWPVGTAGGTLVGMENCSWARVEQVGERIRLAPYNTGATPDFASAAPGR
jgi:probable phosphoglycerate mutase